METISERKRYCPRCHSDQITKSGKNRCLKAVVQRYRCKLCGTSFSNDGYYKGKHALSLLQYARVLYQQGLSYEKIQTRLKRELDIDVSNVAIGSWITKLGIQPRKTSGDQKNKIVRDLVEVGIVTTVRYADSAHPESFLVLGNLVEIIGDERI